METLLLAPDQLEQCADILLRGGVAAVPTETVYGLAANALSREAVGRVFAAKGRPETKPVSLFVPDLAAAERFCHVTGAARKLSVLWPGPLTVVLKRKPRVPDAITAGGEGVGIRVPANRAVLALLRLLPFPLTGTSANLSGAPSLTSAQDVFDALRGRVDAVLRGDCPGGVPSTVVDLTGRFAKLVRLGAIPKETIENLLGTVVE